jgi:Fic/DOC family
MMDRSDLAYFQGNPVPTGTELVGRAALVHALDLKVPVYNPSAISSKHVGGSQRMEGTWRIFDKRYNAGTRLTDHLTFALRHENIDLLILKRAFNAIQAKVIEEFVSATPTGEVARQVWFFYELLTGARLDIDNAPNVAAVDALDPDLYFTTKSILSQRHRVRDNLLGTGAFCPIIRKTDALKRYLALDLAERAKETIGKTGAKLVARAASFMLLADSRASFEIEGEHVPRNRLERWGRAVLEAGKRPLNQTEIYRLHRILIGDDRFTEIGYRTRGVFLGERDHNDDPLPEFIGAKPDDLPNIMTGLNEANNRMRPSDLDPVLQAAAIAFGFVYVHPLADGNGRLHRCLIHHVLAERKFTPPGMVFPVSSVMLDRIDDYRDTLQTHSRSLMPFIEWSVTDDKNVEVKNDTTDLYRYFDCTREAEFLYACVQRTVEQDLPQEIDYLKRNDAALRRIMNMVEMPDQLAQSLILFIRQNDGSLSRRRRENEFSKLTDEEVAAIENIVNEEFEDFRTPRNSDRELP